MRTAQRCCGASLLMATTPTGCGMCLAHRPRLDYLFEERPWATLCTFMDITLEIWSQRTAKMQMGG